MANYRGPRKDRKDYTSITLIEDMLEQMVEGMIPTNVSAFINDSHYISSAPVTSVNGNTGAVVLALFSGNYSDLVGRPTLFSGAYADLTGKPVLFSGSYTDLTNKPTLFSGSYIDLTNKPTIPGAQIQSDWSATTGLGAILNKPTIPTVRRLETYSGVSDASGNYTVVYPTAFSSVPDVQPQLTLGTPAQVVRITSNTVNGFTVNVTNRSSVSLLGLEVLLAATAVVSGAALSVLVTARS